MTDQSFDPDDDFGYRESEEPGGGPVYKFKPSVPVGDDIPSLGMTYFRSSVDLEHGKGVDHVLSYRDRLRLFVSAVRQIRGSIIELAPQPPGEAVEAGLNDCLKSLAAVYAEKFPGESNELFGLQKVIWELQQEDRDSYALDLLQGDLEGLLWRSPEISPLSSACEVVKRFLTANSICRQFQESPERLKHIASIRQYQLDGVDPEQIRYEAFCTVVPVKQDYFVQIADGDQKCHQIPRSPILLIPESLDQVSEQDLRFRSALTVLESVPHFSQRPSIDQAVACIEQMVRDRELGVAEKTYDLTPSVTIGRWLDLRHAAIASVFEVALTQEQFQHAEDSSRPAESDGYYRSFQRLADNDGSQNMLFLKFAAECSGEKLRSVLYSNSHTSEALIELGERAVDQLKKNLAAVETLAQTIDPESLDTLMSLLYALRPSQYGRIERILQYIGRD